MLELVLSSNCCCWYCVSENKLCELVDWVELVVDKWVDEEVEAEEITDDADDDCEDGDDWIGIIILYF